MTSYPPDTLGEYDDDGTMPENVAELAEHVVGHRIVSAEEHAVVRLGPGHSTVGFLEPIRRRLQGHPPIPVPPTVPERTRARFTGPTITPEETP